MDLTPQSETAVAEPAKNTNTVTLDNVFSASFYGDLEKLRNLVEQDGASLSLPDNNGYYPLQWASLKRFPEIVQYMIEHGGDVNAVDNSQQTALHWAALEGSISVADLLLQNGARLEAADVNGYRAVHIAAQCGRTCFLNHIVAKHNADFDVPDNDGRTPLHWAAYKGFADTVRFLLSRDASQDRRDKQGYTPIQLASDQHHRQVALLLSNALQAQGKHLKTCHANSTIGKNWPMIIAMQGDRYTGKSFLAKKLAFRMKCPLICLDDFLCSSEATNELDALISHTFGQIVHIVGTQISLGFSVVIDSPLSHLSHLRQLVGLISSKNQYNTRLLIMECKPTNKYAFQLIFEERGSAIYANRWYKPAAVWPLPELRRDFTDGDIPPMVSKLVVNTTDYYSACQMFTAMFDVTSCGSSHIMEYNSCWNVIHADKAKQFTCPTCTSSESSSSSSSDSLVTRDDNLHKLTVHQDVDLGNKLCGVCDNLVSGPCYTCKDCPLTLHKSCAELARGCKKHFEPKSFPRFVSTEPRLAYSFPVERPCVECREDGKDFSSKCEHCLFESHLKSRLVPTVVRHKAHNGHFCTLKIDSNVGGRTYNYMCLACRKYGKFAAYFLNVHVMYHPECLLLPPSLSHAHGGYTHDLEMVFGFKNELEEDYLCDCCHEKMDPKAWYYYCSDCEVKLHLECAFVDFD